MAHAIKPDNKYIPRLFQALFLSYLNYIFLFYLLCVKRLILKYTACDLKYRARKIIIALIAWQNYFFKIITCNLAWRHGEVPNEWRKAAFVPLYKGKGNKDDCNKYGYYIIKFARQNIWENAD